MDAGLKTRLDYDDYRAIPADGKRWELVDVEGAPLLVIEILSPAMTVYDRATKSQRYAAFGILHYWIVDPMASSLECYRLDGRVYRLAVRGGADGVLSHPDFVGLDLSLPALWR